MTVLVDGGVRVAYRVAHRVLRTWWRVRAPSTRGALVAVWYGGELLLVKNSYRREYTLPGGYVRPGEDPAVAAARELEEELGIQVAPHELGRAYRGSHHYEHRRDTVDIFELRLDVLPPVHIDGREVAWAGFRSPADARVLPLVPHLEDYLAGR